MKPTNFAKVLSQFLGHFLSAQRGLSPNTVRSYRDTFMLLLQYCRDVRGIAPERLRLEQFSPDLISDFLKHLQQERQCVTNTCNQRLAALHAFFRYVQIEEPQRLLQCQRILAIPFKRYIQPIVSYLPAEDLKALLAQPDLSTSSGRRDAVLLSLLYDILLLADKL